MSDTADLLAGVPLLSGLDRKQLEKLAKDFSERTFAAGSTVVREGDEHGVGFFVVAGGEGAVSVGGKEVATVRRGAMPRSPGRCSSTSAGCSTAAAEERARPAPGLHHSRSAGRPSTVATAPIPRSRGR